MLTCDLDEGETPAVSTVTFSYDGETYEFELCQAHLDEFHRTMTQYTAAARPASDGARRRRPASRPQRRTDGNQPDVRAWARANGFEVSARGRIPADVREAYEAANP